MSWHSKETQPPFDHREIHGLHYLDGDLMARLYGAAFLKGQKYPVVLFPSGYLADAWETGRDEQGATLHLFGEMDLPYFQTRDDAYQQAFAIAEACGYAVSKRGADTLEVHGHDHNDHLLIHYDNDTGRMVDVTVAPLPEAPPPHPAHKLVTDALREQFPKLYDNEDLGLDAPALAKYFTPDSHWTWYASEFDGEDIFFGLVVGFEIELGYFSLSELAQVRGSLDLPVERDLHYEPQSLRELRDYHQQLRDEDTT